ncbi:MAG: T9SS type A sorting domain-containing protein [Candidatus Eisenbacteria bacterium]|uniref:T9SS type A sorting domain-containing protein n=1 Tax=Eiseniibacteriota bacterium TaxID=2212470 RepID=A0A849SKF4_UNCEI|nr:T9SS type A sorting domain-containing protein [Candidatus Eisenbacteria bacterium]
MIGEARDFTAEAWVAVPATHRFALAGVRPNPVIGDVNVHFSLASADRAEIELFDIAGRSVASTSLSKPTPGNQHVRLVDGGRLDAGVYWLRLRQGTDVAKSRVVVIR